MTRTEARRIAWRHAAIVLETALSGDFSISDAENYDEESPEGKMLDRAFVEVIAVCNSRAEGNAPRGYRTVRP